MRLKMKKLEQWLDRQTGTVWFACFFNVAVLAVMLLLLRPAFETNDDISVSMVANGSWGTGNAHIICQNYLLGYGIQSYIISGMAVFRGMEFHSMCFYVWQCLQLLMYCFRD